MTITDLGDGCHLHTRDEWHGTREVVNVPDNRVLTDLTQFVVGRTAGNRLGDPSPAQWLRNTYDRHVFELDYNDIAHELAIDATGDVWCARPLHLWSAMVPGHNHHAVACQVLWNYDTATVHEVPTAITVGLRKAFQWVAAEITAAGGNGALLEQATMRDLIGGDSPGDLLCTYVWQGHLDDAF